MKELTIDPRKIIYDKQIRKSRMEKEEIFHYLEKYLSLFDDPRLQNRYAKLLRSLHFPKSLFEIIQKRMERIPLEEIENPQIYITKYRKLFLKIHKAIFLAEKEKGSILSGKVKKDYEFLIEITNFYKNQNWLSSKQIGACHYAIYNVMSSCINISFSNDDHIKMTRNASLLVNERLSSFYLQPKKEKREEAEKEERFKPKENTFLTLNQIRFRRKLFK